MIRKLTGEDRELSLDLSQVAFSVTFTDEQLRARREESGPEQVWGYFIDGRLAAQLAIIPFQVTIQGAVCRMGGIANVGSYPEYRRQGMVGKLLSKSLEVMKDSGQTVSMLNPFSYGFYRKYGWGYMTEVKTYKLDWGCVPKFPPTEGYVRRRSAEDWPVLNGIYEAYAQSYNGLLERSEDWWRKQVFRRKLGSLAVYYNENHVPRAYMLYTVKDQAMKINEWIWLDEEGRRGLWQFVGNHESAVRTVSLSAPSDDALILSLGNPNIQTELYPSFMVRIVDVRPFLAQYRFVPPPESRETLRVRLTDEQAEWNRGMWEIAWTDDGKAAVSHVPGDSENAIACDIQTFSSMLIGFRRPAVLHEAGLIAGTAEAVGRWERSLPARISYFADMF